MSYRWEIFPRQQWPRGFGIRYEPRERPTVDPDQLELAWDLVNAPPPSHQERARRNLRDVFERTRWSQHRFAAAIGCHERTLQRYLAGGRIPEDRAVFLVRLEAVVEHGDRVLTIARRR